MQIETAATLRKALYAVGSGVGMLMNGLGFKDQSIPFPFDLLLMVVGTLLFGWCMRGFLRERQKTARRVDAVLAADQRAPVVYLRSFLADKVAAEDSADLNTLTLSVATEEEQLAQALEPIGPVIAIGRPGEPMPELGSARAYFTDDEWEQAVLGWIDRAALVVLRAGPTEHLFWEFEQVRAHKQPAQVIVLVPESKKEFTPFRDRCLAAGIALPEEATRFSAANLLNPGSIAGFIRFERDWKADYVRLPMRYIIKVHPRTRLGRPLYSVYHHGLAPVFASLHVPWRPLSPSTYMKICYALSVVFIVYAALNGSGR